SGDTNGIDGNWGASLRARAGFLVAPWALLYGTGGIAYMSADMTKSNAPTDQDSLSYTGWTGGGGLELSLSPSVSGRLEYRHVDYGSDDGRVSNYGVQVSPTANQVRVGVSFHL